MFQQFSDPFSHFMSDKKPSEDYFQLVHQNGNKLKRIALWDTLFHAVCKYSKSSRNSMQFSKTKYSCSSNTHLAYDWPFKSLTSCLL